MRSFKKQVSRKLQGATLVISMIFLLILSENYIYKKDVNIYKLVMDTDYIVLEKIHADSEFLNLRSNKELELE